MITFPLSPALSTCDSLADIEDLDAFLEAQGKLSHWPTPPAVKEVTFVAEIETDSVEEQDSSADLDYRYIAEALTFEASVEIDSTPIDVDLVQAILVRAQLPPEVLALAFNILNSLSDRHAETGDFLSTPSDLLVVAGLSLACSLTNDCPPSYLYWSRHVCDFTWTAKRIDKTVLKICSALDWQLHELSSPAALDRTLAGFVEPASPVLCATTAVPVKNLDTDRSFSEQLRLLIDGTNSAWSHGQLTPEESPTGSFDEKLADSFLKLL